MTALETGHRLVALATAAWGEDALDALLGAAQRVAERAGCPFTVLLVGDAEVAALGERACRAGPEEVVWALHEGLAEGHGSAGIADVSAAALGDEALTADSRLVLLPPGPTGEELCARLAARCNGAMLGRCADVSLEADGIQARRATYGGRMRLDMRTVAGNAFATLRAGKPRVSEGGDVRRLPVETTLAAEPTIEVRETSQRLPPIEGARVVVSGGRGVSEAGFAVLEQLAGQLGGTVGASLPAVDAGHAPVSRQVGVSGKFTAADVYIAVGISGTPQHLAGISDDSSIVAINKDAEADIFTVADVGVVADWEDIVPGMVEYLKSDNG